MNNTIHLSENIRTRRKAKGLTQEQLAEALGVTVGAVSKWESGSTLPDIALIMELAALFETSVDALLGYELHKGGVAETIDDMYQLWKERRFDEAIRAAERALIRYPNSFTIVYGAARIYHMNFTPNTASRAAELFRRAEELIDQNTDPRICAATIRERIVESYIRMDKYEKALELLKSNNADGSGSALIGLILATFCHKPEEALPYLSEALGNCIQELSRIGMGYANAYDELGRYEDALAMALWQETLTAGLTSPTGNSTCTKLCAVYAAAAAQMAAKQGDEESARVHLTRALTIARTFDAAPDYTMKHVRFIHGADEVIGFDDCGETAIDAIRSSLRQSGNAEADAMLARLMEEATPADDTTHG